MINDKTWSPSWAALDMREYKMPDGVKCLKCIGFGTLIEEKERAEFSWWRRNSVGCPDCQETGVKPIPESEVIAEGRES